jgi:hypothetical protein
MGCIRTNSSEEDDMTNYDGNRRPEVRERDGMRWGIPALIAAALLIAGVFYFSSSDNRTTTASNNTPATTQSGPAPSGSPVPGPTTTAPAPNR